jgi:hypothetical protein
LGKNIQPEEARRDFGEEFQEDAGEEYRIFKPALSPHFQTGAHTGAHGGESGFNVFRIHTL